MTWCHPWGKIGEICQLLNKRNLPVRCCRECPVFSGGRSARCARVAEAASHRVGCGLAQPRSAVPACALQPVSLWTGAPTRTGGLSTEPHGRLLSGLMRRGLPARSPRGGPASKTFTRWPSLPPLAVVPGALLPLCRVKEAFCLRTRWTRSPVILSLPRLPARPPALGLSCGRWLSPPSGSGSSAPGHPEAPAVTQSPPSAAPWECLVYTISFLA